jgi:hypothetical protein
VQHANSQPAPLRPRRRFDVDLVEYALLLALCLVGLIAILGKLSQYIALT